MSLPKPPILIALATLVAAACAPHRAEPEPLPEAVILTAEQMAVLAFLNDPEGATQEVLDLDCAIRRDAATNIVLHRDGPDGQPGTRDDNPFTTPDELLAVKQVGPWTVEQLTACASALGYEPAPDEVAVLNFVNDPATTHERLDLHCSLRSDTVEAILLHRDGADGLPGTADDDPFHSLAELDGVYGVGQGTLGQLVYCASRFGYQAVTDPEAPR